MPPKATSRSNNNNNSNMTNYLINEDSDDAPRWAQRLETRIMEQLQKVTDWLDQDGVEIRALKERLIHSDYHSRKYNLLIFGLKIGSADECEKKVVEFFKTDLEIDEADRMLFAACHPLPGANPSSIVRFVKLSDRDKVLRSLGKLKGKGKRITVMTDLPSEAREKRKMLSKTVAEGRKNGDAIRLRERGLNLWIEEKKEGRWVKRN
jgi:hypothetical protein